ncbi:MAG: Crp/Fnr family transcriptional regulator, partial [Rhodospirillaceae bacterium]
GIARAMLPSPTLPKAPAEGAVLACGQAAVFLSKRSEALSTYFLRRYRALLVAHLVYSGLLSQDQADRLDSERVFLSELFEDDDLDPLNYLRSVLPKTKHALLPAVALTDVTLPLESDLADLQSLCELLPHDTDRRLWRVGAEGAIDQDALETLHGLEMFNSVDALKHLPARDIFDVIRTSTLVTLAPGDVLIWQGEWTRDVFLLLDGQLGIGRRAAEDGKNAKVREGVESTGTPDETIEPGEVIGEMSFLSAAPRRATITALAPSHCMVLKDADLRALIFDHPSILLTIAKRLAQRVWGQDGQ